MSCITPAEVPVLSSLFSGHGLRVRAREGRIPARTAILTGHHEAARVNLLYVLLVMSLLITWPANVGDEDRISPIVSMKTALRGKLKEFDGSWWSAWAVN